MATDTTWGQLQDSQHGNSPVRFRFPWDSVDRTATFTKRGYLSSWDEDGTERWTHYLRAEGIGPEVTMRVDTPVTVNPAATPAAKPAKKPAAT